MRFCRASTRQRISTRSGERIDQLIDNIHNALGVADSTSDSSSICCSNSIAAPCPTAAATARLESRIESFELAYRMQSEAAEAFDISREPESAREMYGKGAFARQALIATSAGRTGRSFCPAVHRRRTALGQPRRPGAAASRSRRGCRPADRCLADRSETDGLAR